MAYQKLMRSAVRKYAGSAWLEYGIFTVWCNLFAVRAFNTSDSMLSMGLSSFLRIWGGVKTIYRPLASPVPPAHSYHNFIGAVNSELFHLQTRCDLPWFGGNINTGWASAGTDLDMADRWRTAILRKPWNIMTMQLKGADSETGSADRKTMSVSMDDLSETVPARENRSKLITRVLRLRASVRWPPVHRTDSADGKGRFCHHKHQTPETLFRGLRESTTKGSEIWHPDWMWCTTSADSFIRNTQTLFCAVYRPRWLLKVVLPEMNLDCMDNKWIPPTCDEALNEMKTIITVHSRTEKANMTLPELDKNACRWRH